jgi:ribonuclease R
MPKQDPYLSREQEKYDNPIPSREFILDHIKNAPKPLNYDDLVALLLLDDEERQVALLRRLRAMERDGQLLLNKSGNYCLPDKIGLVKGKVIGHREGFGFLQLDEGGKDWFIPKHQMDSLIHGDRVLAKPASFGKNGKCEARIVRVIDSERSSIIGRYYVDHGMAVVVPEDPRISQEIVILPGDENGARHNQMVEIELTQRPNKRMNAFGRVLEVLGEHMAPGMEIEVALRNHDIPNQWPEAVIRQVSGLTEEVQEQDKSGRVDLRHLPLVTIDGEDARDFDDAVYCEAKKTGGWRLWVAIADVSHYVKKGSALDLEAIERGNSVYFPSEVIPMLPKVLSNGLCSLNPHVDRLCMVAEMTISAAGKLSGYRFYEAVMRSQARLTYTQVGALLQGDEGALGDYQQLNVHIKELHKLYLTLKGVRLERGAMEFETVEPKFLFDSNRKIESIISVSRNDAHKLIEECMILANVAAAKLLEKHEMPSLYRVHAEPDPEKLMNFVHFLSELGLEVQLSQQPEPKELADMYDGLGERKEMELIQTMLLRSMKQAVYQADNIGHYGLALPAYAHFTSPIRRYPDLVVHRGIKAILKMQQQATSGAYHYQQEEVDVLGDQCSMTERRADDATREVADWLKCEFMQDRVGQVFSGVISSVTNFGLFVRLDELYIDGMVHVTSLTTDYYHFDAKKHCLIGESSKQVFRMGDKIDVIVTSVSLDDRRINLALAGASGSQDRYARRRKQSTSLNANGKADSVREQLKSGKLGAKSERGDSKGKKPFKGKGGKRGEGKKLETSPATKKSAKKPKPSSAKKRPGKNARKRSKTKG